MPISLPDMPEPQQGAWEAVFEIYEALPEGWVLVGGQAVYLHCGCPPAAARVGSSGPALSGASLVRRLRWRSTTIPAGIAT